MLYHIHKRLQPPLPKPPFSKTLRLVIDQQWLKDHGLNSLLKKRGIDFHYVPHPDDELKVEVLLKSGTTTISEVTPGKETPVTFIKSL